VFSDSSLRRGVGEDVLRGFTYKRDGGNGMGCIIGWITQYFRFIVSSNLGGKIALILGTICAVGVEIILAVEMFRKGNIDSIVIMVFFAALAMIALPILGLVGVLIGIIIEAIVRLFTHRS
jgi:hypothetical protein